MTELRRLELALAVLAASAVGLVAVASLDVVLHHAAVLPLEGAVAAVVLGRGLASLARQLRGQRRLLEHLRARPAVVEGHAVLIVPGRMLGAFCAGFLRPAIYLSEATLRCAETELRAVLAHEEHHRRRRDPLRLLLARGVSDAFRPLPLFATLADHQAAVADLMADAAAVSAAGARPLAAALARFDAHGAGVAPERVDRLVRSALPLTVSAALPVAAAVALGAIAAPLLLGNHPELEHVGLLAACLPACLAARRAGACLRVDADSANY
jgi:bla regulator protein blaR1